MFCFKCGKEIADNAKFCGFCGAVIESSTNVTEEPTQSETAIINEQAYENVNTYDVSAKIEDPKPKKKKGKTVRNILIIAAAVIVVVLGGFLFRHPLMQLVMPADSYLRHVEKNNIENLASNIGDFVTEYKTALNGEDKNVAKTETSVEIGKEGHKLIEEYVSDDIDVSWLEKVSLSYDGQFVKNKLAVDVSAGLNDKDIVSAEIYMDKEYVYFSIPELSKEVFKINISEAYEEADISSEEIEEIFEKIPDGKVVEKILVRYFELVLEQVEDVEKEKDTIEVEGISQKVTLYTAEIDGEVVYNASKVVLKELKEDAEIKDIIVDFSDKDTYNEFKDAIDELLDDLDKDYFEDMPKIEYKVWVGSNGMVVGRGFEVEEVEFVYYTPTKGSKIGMYAACSENGNEYFALGGSGKISKGKLSGEFVVSIQEKEMLKVALKDCTIKPSKNKENTFNFSVSAEKDFVKLLEDEDAPEEVIELISDASLNFDMKYKAESNSSLKFSWLNNNKNVVAISIKTSVSDGAKVSIPKDAVDIEDEDIEDYIDEETLTEYGEKRLDRIYDAGCTEELVDEIIDAFEEYSYDDDYYYDDEYDYEDEYYYDEYEYEYY